MAEDNQRLDVGQLYEQTRVKVQELLGTLEQSYQTEVRLLREQRRHHERTYQERVKQLEKEQGEISIQIDSLERRLAELSDTLDDTRAEGKTIVQKIEKTGTEYGIEMAKSDAAIQEVENRYAARLKEIVSALDADTKSYKQDEEEIQNPEGTAYQTSPHESSGNEYAIQQTTDTTDSPSDQHTTSETVVSETDSDTKTEEPDTQALKVQSEIPTDSPSKDEGVRGWAPPI